MSVIRAPEIAREGAVWLNTPRPLSLGELRGKLVVLDFWTLGCINCVHVIPTLRRIERAFPEEVVVIGIHSPKFSAEKDPERVAQAVRRLGIEHPVLLDNDLRLWEAYAVQGWPTLVVVDPTGRIARVVLGEPEPAEFFAYFQDAVDGWGQMDLLTSGRTLPESAGEGRDGTPAGYRFPTRIAPLPGTRHFVVADSGNDRIAIVDSRGVVLRRIGSGSSGFSDGAAATAEFNRPEGVAADDRFIYVADTANHAIRAVDRNDYQVRTLAGTGERGPILPFEPGTGEELASPTDLEVDGSSLFFSNAGSHQLGMLDLETRAVRAVAGNGEENLVDGPVAQALLAQPTGLTLDRSASRLYFTDSESSAVRCLDLAGEPAVRTLVGKGLFTWGEQDGPFDDALLQHPHDLLHRGSSLFVADSYNNTVRELDLTRGTVSDLLAGFTCLDAVCVPLAEPGGLAWNEAAGRLVVADTNNHRLLELDLRARTYRTWGDERG